MILTYWAINVYLNTEVDNKQKIFTFYVADILS